MAKREFSYKGKTLEELKSMSNADFAKLLPSRQKRSLLHGVNREVDKKVEEALKAKDPGKIIRTHRRDSIITPKMIGLKFGIHSGKEFQVVEIQKEMLGHRLGEFVLTRKKLKHGKAGIGATKSSTAITARG